MDERLIKRWTVTEKLLRDAAGQLGGEAIPDFEKFLKHNELGLALDCLVDEGDLRGAPGSYWRLLKQIADLMGLLERRNELRRRVRDAERKLGQ